MSLCIFCDEERLKTVHRDDLIDLIKSTHTKHCPHSSDSSSSSSSSSRNSSGLRMSVEPHIQEIPPDYQEVVAEDQSENKATDRTDNVNVGFEPDIDRIEVAVESTEGSKKGGITGKTTPAASSVIPSSSTSEKKASNIQGMETLTTQEEKMLSVLRDVAQKCTNANPLKRPTAEQVLKMLQAINPYPDDYDDDDVDDDDADDGDDVEMKYKVEDVAVTKIRNEIALVTS